MQTIFYSIQNKTLTSRDIDDQLTARESRSSTCLFPRNNNSANMPGQRCSFGHCYCGSNTSSCENLPSQPLSDHCTSSHCFPTTETSVLAKTQERQRPSRLSCSNPFLSAGWLRIVVLQFAEQHTCTCTCVAGASEARSWRKRSRRGVAKEDAVKP